MHRLVTLQVVAPKLHTVSMRTILGGMQQKFFWGMPPPGSAVSYLNEVIGNAETE